MVSAHRVVCLIPHAPNIAEQLRDFSREDSLILKPPNELVLPLLCRNEAAHATGRQLC